MKKNVGILIFDDAEVLDFAGPFEVFSVTSQLNNFELFNTFTVAKCLDNVHAVNGLIVKPNHSFIDHPKIDILIISGGQGTRQLLDDHITVDWVSKVQKNCSLTLSICSGSRILGKLGLLDKKPYCTHHAVYEHMDKIVKNGIPKADERFIQSDEYIFTSGGISAGIDLSFHIIEKLLGKDISKRTAEYMEYNYQS
jgi:transcriptional regulator GlxA family with amidase domain